MIMHLGPKPADWIIIYINDQSVRFTVLPFGKIHTASYDVLLNPVTPRTDPDELEQEMLVAEDLVRQSRWAVLTHVSQVDIAPTLTTDNHPPDHRNGAIKP